MHLGTLPFLPRLKAALPHQRHFARPEQRKLVWSRETFGQDGGVGRYTLPPRTTKRRTTNLITKNNQSCQKIKLYGSPTTKKLKKKQSSRPVGGAETGSWVESTRIKGAAQRRTQRLKRQLVDQNGRGSSWRNGWSHICMWINWEKQLGSETDHTTQGSSAGK